MALHYKREFSYENLKEFTNEFSEENFIGKFQFGKVYRGMYKNKEVTLKIWEDPQIYTVYPGDNERRIRDEVCLLEYFTKGHPNLVELIGYCSEGQHLGTVYDLNSLDTLHNLLAKGSFTWPQRIKVALGFACLLEYMHAKNPRCLPYLIRNIDAAHIMLDRDYNPKLYDFSMISGGILADRRDLLNECVHGCYGYVDPSFEQGGWSDKCDVFAYGVVLLGLITERVYTDEDRINNVPYVHEWAQSEYKSLMSTMSNIGRLKISPVHHNLMTGPLFNPSDGIKITNLAMQCVEHNLRKRPTMKQVVRCLLDLRVVQDHADIFGIDQMVCVDEACSTMEELTGFPRLMVKKLDSQPTCCHIHMGGRSKFQKILQIPWNLCLSCDGRLLRGSQKNPTRIQAGKEESKLRVFSYQDLNLCTDSFSEENFIGEFQFGKVYHGKIETQKVTVKIWKNNEKYIAHKGHNESRLSDETVLLQHPKLISHPNLVNLIGYCYEGEHLGAVYDLNSVDTVHNLLPKDSFTWLQRIRVAFGFACLLKFLHVFNPPYSLPYLVRNIDAAHIMLDQDYNPKLFDFGMFTGGILPDRRCFKYQVVCGCHGYIDPNYARVGYWSEMCDVYAFGVVLISLIAKRVCTEDFLLLYEKLSSVGEWTQQKYEEKMSTMGSDKSRCSLVHQSLEVEPGFYYSDGPELTQLAIQCMEYYPRHRPSMNQVVKRLLNLRVVRCHADTLGVNQTLHRANP